MTLQYAPKKDVSMFPITAMWLAVTIAVIALLVQVYLAWSHLWAIPSGTTFRDMGLAIWVLFVSFTAFLIDGLLTLQCLALKAWRCFLVTLVSCIVAGPGSLIIAGAMARWITRSHGIVWGE